MSLEDQKPTPHVRVGMLNRVKSEGGGVVIYLTNGIKLSGKLLDFDSESILLDHKDDSRGMVVERQAIASIRGESNEGGKSR